jgi:Tfp pilus assembly protein PilX
MTFDLRNQDGVAMPVMTWMLVVVSLLVTGFFTVSVQLSDSTNEDRSSKRALAAAEAGLQTAVYRLNQIDVAATQCLADAPTNPGTGSECQASSAVQLGGGASVTYYVTPTFENLPAGDQVCVSVLDQASMPTDRCVTAVGSVNGVTRRLQVRVANQPGPPTFNQVGVLGKTQVFLGNSSEVKADVGTNGNAHFGNSAKTFELTNIDVEGSVLRGPGSTYTTEGSGQVVAGGQVFVPAFEFDPIDFAAAQTAAVNLTTPGWTKSGYNTTTKHWVVSGTQSLNPGTYLFCRLHLNDGAKLRFPHASQPTKVYIDSPSRVGSPCYGQALAHPTHAGTFTADNSNEINMDAGKEHLVDFFVGGTAVNGTRNRYPFCDPKGSPIKFEECRSDVVMDNSVKIKASIYAPTTTVEANNSVEWWGAIGADKIRFNNSVKFELTEAVKERPSGSQGAALRTAWGECRPTPDSANDPESGC